MISLSSPKLIMTHFVDTWNKTKVGVHWIKTGRLKHDLRVSQQYRSHGSPRSWRTPEHPVSCALEQATSTAAARTPAMHQLTKGCPRPPLSAVSYNRTKSGNRRADYPPISPSAYVLSLQCLRYPYLYGRQHWPHSEIPSPSRKENEVYFPNNRTSFLFQGLAMSTGTPWF